MEPRDREPERKRFPDELDEEPVEESAQAPPVATTSESNWTQRLQLAASLAAVTAISLLTLEMAMGAIRLGKLVAYVMGSSLLIAALLALIIGFTRVLPRFEPGLKRYLFWAVAVPISFLYYLALAFLIYGYFSPLLIKVMGAAMTRFP